MYKYKLGERLGGGSFGEAFLAWKLDSPSEKMVVIKKVPLRGKASEETMKEVEVLKTLQDPTIDWSFNFIRYRDSFQEGGYLHIVTDYANGGDLRELIELHKEKRLLLAEMMVLDIFIQIALAIDEIHSRNIMHRDLKPANIFFLNPEHGKYDSSSPFRMVVKVGDFGLSKVLEYRSQICLSSCGTPAYMAPEVYARRGYTNKADIWSLGCILYELCTLNIPFPVQSRAPIRSTYSRDLRNLVDWMLENKPERRPTIKEVLSTPIISKHVDHLRDIVMRRMMDAYERERIVSLLYEFCHQDECQTARERARAGQKSGKHDWWWRWMTGHQ